jgi:hypothetical protein
MSLDEGGLYSGVVLSEAMDTVKALLEPDISPDTISDLLERAASDSDLAHAVMFYLLLSARGIPYGDPISDGLTAKHVHGGQLILPPDFHQ